jgi:hypothetical protein
MPISATQACAEATASASEDEVMLITIEPICPAFVESGAPSPRERQRFDKALPTQNTLVFRCLRSGSCYTHVLQGPAPMGRMKYLQRRANRFEFRFPLPEDLAGNPIPPRRTPAGIPEDLQRPSAGGCLIIHGFPPRSCSRTSCRS